MKKILLQILLLPIFEGNNKAELVSSGRLKLAGSCYWNLFLFRTIAGLGS